MHTESKPKCSGRQILAGKHTSRGLKLGLQVSQTMAKYTETAFQSSRLALPLRASFSNTETPSIALHQNRETKGIRATLVPLGLFAHITKAASYVTLRQIQLLTPFSPYSI
ncbi:hypothetical protein L204_102962 [Cryptococcus depauperatus]